MKKVVPIIICTIVAVILYPLCVDYGKQNYPNEYYNVYLDEQLLGTILSEKELLNYIEANTEKIINIETITKTYCEDERSLEEIITEENLKEYISNLEDEQYIQNNKKCIDVKIKNGTEIGKIYTPIGLEVEKVLTYNPTITSVEDVYSEIVDKKSFTIKGYQFTIKKEDKEIKINVADKKIFEDSVKSFIELYVGKEEYAAYLNNTQIEVKTTGSIIENVYIDQTITVKEKQIPIDEKIYTKSEDLTQFLVYGENPVTKIHKVQSKEMIASIAFDNEMSSQEFLISNSKYKNENSLLAVGSEVIIKQTNPQLSVVVEKYISEDKKVDYNTVYEYDETQYQGYQKTTQEGIDGLQRVKQRLKIMNGEIVYVEPKGKETLKASVDEIIVKGEKLKPNVGDLNNWAWMSESGWVYTGGWSWRIHPIKGTRAFHYGIDIAGTGYNSDIYAANNGTIITMEYHYSFGNYVVINHNNGYYTLYAHMNKFMPNLKVGDTVLRGQQIGYVGSTGESTGPHIHFELWKGCLYCRINPWSIYQ